MKTKRLIEEWLPIKEVGVESRRENSTGQHPPPNRLHVWWARRPLTASRAAILGSILPAWEGQPGPARRALRVRGRIPPLVPPDARHPRRPGGGRGVAPTGTRAECSHREPEQASSRPSLWCPTSTTPTYSALFSQNISVRGHQPSSILWPAEGTIPFESLRAGAYHSGR